MTVHAVLLLSLICAIAASTGESLAATGSWVKVNETTYPLNDSYAVPSPNALPSEKKNGTFDRYLILVDTPIPDQFFADPFWYSHIRQDPKIHGLYFVVDAKGKLIGGGLLLRSLESPDGIWSIADFAIASSDAQHLEGAGKISERRLPDGTTVAFDLTFNAPLWKPAPERPTSPEDAKRAAASPQAKVYFAFLAALKSGIADAFRATLSADAKKEMGQSPEALAGLMKIFREIAPKNPRVLRLTLDGGTAQLEVADGAASAGVVQFVLEGAQWRIRNIDSN
jgi:hypothetical protein